MAAASPLTELSIEAVRDLGGPSWLAEARGAAWERFRSQELPTEAEEIWRYSRIDSIELGRFNAPDSATPASGRAGAEGLSGATAELTDRAATIVVTDGVVTEVSVEPAAERAGLRVRPLRRVEASDAAGLGAVAGSADAFVDLSTSLTADGLLVELASGAVVTDPVVVIHHVTAPGGAIGLRTIVRTGTNSQGSVVEELRSVDESVLVLPVVELDLEEGSNLDYASVQALGPQAWQVGYQASRLGRDASLRSLVVALGGYYARVRTDSRLVDTGGSSRLLALYFGDGDQMHDFRTLQEHVAPKTTSDLLFKGAVKDTSHSVYSGLIRVRPGAAGTNAFQTNRNLVLTEGATAWSVPNLEIEENDVRCSHASAVGPVDEEQMYYLESRGIRPDDARRLIVIGFFQDLLRGAPVPALHGALRRMVVAKLIGAAG